MEERYSRNIFVGNRNWYPDVMVNAICSNNILFAADFNVLGIPDKKGIVKIFNIRNGKFVKEFNVFGFVNALSFTLDTKCIVICFTDEFVVGNVYTLWMVYMF